MTLTILASVALLFAVIPAYLFSFNVFRFRTLDPPELPGSRCKVSVLIPARNEEASIGNCLETVLANQHIDLEVIVLDDASEDRTAEVVSELASQDSRLRLAQAEQLPPGWCGKQFACHQLAQLATNDLLVFLDADVRLEPDGLSRMLTCFKRENVDLLSGFPRQITVSTAEQLLIPLIHFVLLGFLSLRKMRRSCSPAFSAGCGQLFMTNREAYEKSGGHAAIRSSLHDGLKLPRLYRRHQLTTDIFDATDLATCRMYHNAKEVWQGLKKNATEGIASPGLIMPVTLMLLFGQVLPFPLFLWTMLQHSIFEPACLMSGLAICLAWTPRFIAARRFRQPLFGALMHPLAVVVFLLIQWSALLGSFSQQKVAWKGRPYPA